MRVKLLTFRYSATLGGFDDEALTHFIRDKEVIAFREHFYSVNEVPHLTCVVHYQDALVPREVRLDPGHGSAPPPRPMPRTTPPQHEPNGQAHDPLHGLDEAQRVLFNHLREWRSRTAHDEGVPPYVVLTNRQLVAVVQKRPDSATALGHVEGIGAGKVKRYGRQLLEALHGGPRPAVETAVAIGVPADVPVTAPRPEVTP